jgi:Ca2+-binding EF-hand superfamily protein
MQTKTKWIIAGTLLALTAGGAYAADSMRRDFGEQRQRVAKMVFDRIDTDHDGAISADEMTAAITKRFSDADANGDGLVTKAEAVAAIEAQTEFERARKHAGRIADGLFYRVDLDDNGQVALAEIENRAKKAFALVDWNDDGKVDVAEIARMRPQHAGFHRMGWRWRDRSE